ncbi:NAD(P)H-binding protein [Sodalis sp. dw_96]|uniref:NAD(P)H-binding protein n=1 Tax=Sodalis sp. dw_96 TaxID=2719794 RepID=UPI001BD29E5C|nr:NAD(P)H-binding protein [Sodalis sp. dw_96]
MSKIIITGVDGQFGGIAAEHALKRKPAGELIFTSPFPEKISHYQDKGVEVRKADFSSKDSLTKAFAGGESILLISMPIVGDERVAMHTRAIEAAKAAGVRHIVYTSIVGAGDPANDALVTIDHNATEELIKDSGLTYKIARNGQYSEAITEYSLPSAFQTGKWTVNEGDGQMAYISRRDCAEAAAALVCGKGDDNHIYYITGPELLTKQQIVTLAEDMTGREIELIDISDDQTYAFFDSLGVPRTTANGMVGSPIPWCSDDMVSFGRAVREGKMAVSTDDFGNITGHKAVSLRQLIGEAIKKGLYN